VLRLTTLLVEMGDKTQLAPIALATRYDSLIAVALGMARSSKPASSREKGAADTRQLTPFGGGTLVEWVRGNAV
jgi:hypothetical protein